MNLSLVLNQARLGDLPTSVFVVPVFIGGASASLILRQLVKGLRFAVDRFFDRVSPHTSKGIKSGLTRHRKRLSQVEYERLSVDVKN
jgi:hypothetical protein